ncbi:MAG TPA: toll/interleukin-1 receptor domain-containing protein [Ktedonobacterales bacterium]
MSKIFISYRREQSAVCARLAERLAVRFGRDAVVRDVFRGLQSIPSGSGLEQFLSTALAQCAVQLVLIGPRWAQVADENGRARLDNPTDVVRLEIEMALQRSMVVIPLVVGGGTMPVAEELPPALHELASRNGMPLRDDPDFAGDVERVDAAIAREMPVQRAAPGQATPGQATPSSYAALPGIFTGAAAPRRRSAFLAPTAAGVLALALVLSSVAVVAFAQHAPPPQVSVGTAGSGPTPTPSPPPGVIYQNSLTTGAPGWVSNVHCFPGTDGFHVADGQYLCLPGLTSDVPTASDATITVQAKQIKGNPQASYGLVFRANPVFGNYYALLVAPAGEWCAGHSDGQTWTFDVNWSRTTAIHQGENATNELKARLYGQQLDFTINGVHVGAAQDTNSNTNGSDNNFGFVGSDGAEAVFSNLKVTDPTIP